MRGTTDLRSSTCSKELMKLVTRLQYNKSPQTSIALSNKNFLLPTGHSNGSFDLDWAHLCNSYQMWDLLVVAELALMSGQVCRLVKVSPDWAASHELLSSGRQQ